tara:strand:- start:91 stop:606 length:516 start_codon:yes stop_codon:yes gene_type:complete
MNNLIIHTIFIVIFAILYSILEIEIEGKSGWAENLPTQYSGIGRFTYYHIILNIIIILVITYSTLLLKNTNLWIVLFYIIICFLVKDFSWFVLNPYYTLDKYSRENIWWYSDEEWILKNPMHNWIGIIFLLLILIITQNIKLLNSLIVTIIMILIVILISEEYHRWYIKTH